MARRGLCWSTRVTLALLAAGMLTATANAQASGDKIRGAALAESWCVSCHIIDKRGTGRAVDPAPPFPLIANDPKKTFGYLQQWLSTSHPQMPNFNLGHREIVDLIAYIRSLRPSPVQDPKNSKSLIKKRRDASNAPSDRAG